MAEIQISIPANLGLSAEQQLAEKLQSQLIETIPGAQAEATKPKVVKQATPFFVKVKTKAN